MDVKDKEEVLRKKVGERDSMLIAYSGGVDSSLLAGIAHEVLGDRCRAVLLESPVVPGPPSGRRWRPRRGSGYHSR